MAFVIPSIFTAIDKFSPVVKGMSGSVDAFAAKAERSIRKVGQSAEKIGAGAAIIGTAIAAPLILATKAAIDFEKGMGNIATLGVPNIEKMGAEVLTLSKTMPVSVEDMTTSLYSIVSAGVSAADAMSVLEASSKLSVAGLSTVSQATDLTTSAINAFAQQGLSAGEITNILMKTVKAGKTTVAELASAFGSVAPAATAAGVSLQELSAATAALTLNGVPTSQAQNQLKALFDESTRTSGKLADAYAKLGKGNIAAAVKAKGFMAVLQEVKSSVGGNEIAFKNLFSSQEAGGAALTLTGSKFEAYKATLLGMEGGVDALTEAFLKQMGTSSNQMKLMENQNNALAITIGQVLLPILNKLINKITPIIEKFSNWAKENPKLFKGLVIGAAAVAAFAFAVSAMSFAVAIGSKAVMLFGMSAKVVTAAQWAWNAAMTANPIGLIIVGIAAMIALVALAIANWNEWGAALSMFLGPIGMIVSLFMAFKNNWDMIVASFKTDGILGGIIAIGKTLLDSVLYPLQQILEVVARVTGSDMAAKAAESIASFRQEMGVSTGGETQGAATPAVNTEKGKQEALVQRMENTQSAKVQLDINDPNNRIKPTSTGAPIVSIKSTSTTGFNRE
jgi:TP901 family phage tail tape measure protein